MTDTSLPKIGETFGGRDHTTALHAYEKISAEIKSNPSTAVSYTHLVRELIVKRPKDGGQSIKM